MRNQALMVHNQPPRGVTSSAATVLRKITRGKHQSADCGRAWDSRTAGRGDRGAARRRRHRAVRGAVPQGNHRRARRCAIAHPGRAPDLFARARGTPYRHPRIRARTGQARRKPGGGHHGSRHQGPSGRHLSAVQAEAPHQGRNRQGGGAGTAGRSLALRSRAGSDGRRCAVRRCGEAGRRCRGRARRRARHPGRAFRGGCRPDRRPARADVVERRQ